VIKYNSNLLDLQWMARRGETKKEMKKEGKKETNKRTNK
jgi:hypothetical protein